MSDNVSNELVERYLYDVVRRLPEKQKKDIEQELRTLIEDMIAEKEEAGTPDREECIKAVLNELGSPVKLARSYRGEHDYLISGEYYDSYCFILKIVLICTTAGMLISNIVSAVVHVAEGMAADVWNDMLDLGSNLGSIPMVLIQVFGVITLIYAIMERNHVKVNVNEQAWTLESLPQIPYKKAVISRGESAAGIVFGILVAIIFTFAPQLLGAWIKQNNEMISIPIFNLTIWSQILPLFIISIISGVVEDFIKLIIGRYNYTVMAVAIVMNTISFASTIIAFKLFHIWNEDFIPKLQEATGRIISAKGDILTYFNTDLFTNGLLLVILLFILLDMGKTIYYAVRYGNK